MGAGQDQTLVHHCKLRAERDGAYGDLSPETPMWQLLTGSGRV